MKVVLQRVREAQVEVDGRVVGSIDHGLVALVGIGRNDSQDTIGWMARKVAGLRIFSDADGKMNESLRDTKGGCLAVSQFTLFGDCRKGTRPGLFGGESVYVVWRLSKRHPSRIFHCGTPR